MARRIGIVPGVGYDKYAYWHLIVVGSIDQYLLLSYRKKKDAVRNRTREVEEQKGIRRYAKRILRQLLEADDSFDLIGHSMGWPIICALLELIEERNHQGLVGNVVGLTPAITGGSPAHRFYQDPRYLWQRYWDWQRPSREFRQAVEHIQKHSPDFCYRCSGEEINRAVIQAVTGEIPEPTVFDRRLMHLMYSVEDRVIPFDITEAMARRAGISYTPFSGYGGHSVPIIDVDGVILREIEKQFAAMERSVCGVT